MSTLQLRGLTCRYGDTLAVRGIDLEVASGEFVTFLGPSGSGKTSVLRMIGGYIPPTSGQILVDGRDISRLPPQQRNIGMVFQNYALFPHMTVFDNVAFGLRARRKAKPEIAERVMESLEMVRLADYAKRQPHELSGGQQQRVALARAIAIRPTLMLMDEPLGALDAQLRESVQVEIKRIQRQLGITTIYVTHDQNEAFSMSDRIVLMSEGDVDSIGTPEELYLEPKSVFAAQFVGHSAVLPVDVVRWNGTSGAVSVAGQAVELEVQGPPPEAGRACYVTVQPEKVRFSPEPIPGRTLTGTVLARRYTGFEVLLIVDVAGQRLVATDPERRYREEDTVHVYWDSDMVKVLQA